MFWAWTVNQDSTMVISHEIFFRSENKLSYFFKKIKWKLWWVHMEDREIVFCLFIYLLFFVWPCFVKGNYMVNFLKFILETIIFNFF